MQVPLCCALCSLVAVPMGYAPRIAPITMKVSKPVNEFSRAIGVASLGRKASRNLIKATDDECAALAKRFDLVSIGTLAANVSLAIIEPRRTRVRTYGSFTATEVVQRSIIDGERQTTLQLEKMPFETFFIDEEFAEDDAGSGSYDSDVDESYDEYIEEGQIDMGELVAQHLYLALSDRQQLVRAACVPPACRLRAAARIHVQRRAARAVKLACHLRAAARIHVQGRAARTVQQTRCTGAPSVLPPPCPSPLHAHPALTSCASRLASSLCCVAALPRLCACCVCVCVCVCVGVCVL